jgi:hypothetical protein
MHMIAPRILSNTFVVRFDVPIQVGSNATVAYTGGGFQVGLSNDQVIRDMRITGSFDAGRVLMHKRRIAG